MTKSKRVLWIVILAFFGGLAVVDRLVSLKSEGSFRLPETTVLVENQNRVRKEYGVPLIESEWVLVESDSNYLHWSSRIRGVNTVQPFHMSKTIRLQHGKATIEEDDFHFEASDSIAFRLVLIHRYDEKGTMKRVRNEFITYYKGKYPPTSTKTVRNEFVDSILFKWNLKPSQSYQP